MRLDDLAYDREAETCTLRAAGDEWLEQKVPQRFGHSAAGVGDRKDEPISRPFCAKRHPSARRRILDRVEDEVVDCLDDPAPIEYPAAAAAAYLECHPMRRRLFAEQIGALLNEGVISSTGIGSGVAR